MRITVFGAAGNVGSRVVTEALSRGHHITAVVRGPARFPELPTAAEARIGGAAAIEDVAHLSAGQDVVISAIRPVSGRENELVTATKALLTGVARTGGRLLLVGGAATLTVPGSGILAMDDPAFVPAAYQDIARACAGQLATCRDASDVDWTYLSPPAQLEPGIRTGSFRLGTDELLVDTAGNSAISMEDLAVALVDEAEHARHHRSRFTVAY